MMMKCNRIKDLNNQGFTIVELMIAMVISAIIVAVIYSSYKMQRDVFEAQDQVTEVQQNLRAATWQMTREIRMAGFDPQEAGEAKIVAAKNDLLYFTLDKDEDGEVDGTGEQLAYDLYTDANGKSILGRTSADKEIKIADKGGGHWEVTPAAVGDPSHQPEAENIEELEFYYTLEDGTSKTDPTAVELPYIRAIQISMLARTRHPDREYNDSLVYCPASNPYNSATQKCTDPNPATSTVWGPFNDNFRRRMLTTTVTCRNLGL